MKYGLKIAALAVAGCIMGGATHAAIIYSETFDTDPGIGDGGLYDALDANFLTPPTFDYTTDGDSVGTEAWSGSTAHSPLGNPAESLVVDYTSGIGLDVDRVAITDPGFAGAGDAGNYSATHVSGKDQFFGFDFYWADTAATPSYNGLQVYFVGGGVTWYYAVNTSGQAQSTWRSYEVDLGSSSGWTDTGAGGVFNSDKQTVTEIGFRFNYITSTDNTFAFDNLRRGYNVPEPETYAAIAAALIGLCMVSRKRLAELLGPSARMPWAA